MNGPGEVGPLSAQFRLSFLPLDECIDHLDDNEYDDLMNAAELAGRENLELIINQEFDMSMEDLSLLTLSELYSFAMSSDEFRDTFDSAMYAGERSTADKLMMRYPTEFHIHEMTCAIDEEVAYLYEQSVLNPISYTGWLTTESD